MPNRNSTPSILVCPNLTTPYSWSGGTLIYVFLEDSLPLSDLVNGRDAEGEALGVRLAGVASDEWTV